MRIPDLCGGSRRFQGDPGGCGTVPGGFQRSPGGSRRCRNERKLRSRLESHIFARDRRAESRRALRLTERRKYSRPDRIRLGRRETPRRPFFSFVFFLFFSIFCIISNFPHFSQFLVRHRVLGPSSAAPAPWKIAAEENFRSEPTWNGRLFARPARPSPGFPGKKIGAREASAQDPVRRNGVGP
jgi:hypothetical protein